MNIELFVVDEKLYNKDVKSITEWMNVKSVNELLIEKKYINIDLLEKQINEMESTYKEFKSDLIRSRKIFNKINKGSTVEPIYIEKNDKHLFVMEGRHRMVAFKWLNIREIPVMFVSKLI